MIEKGHLQVHGLQFSVAETFVFRTHGLKLHTPLAELSYRKSYFAVISLHYVLIITR